MISLATADIPVRAYRNILDCLLEKRIGRGKYVSIFEEKIARYFNAKHAIAVSNGTLADIIMLSTLKEIYKGKDQVILPAFTFVAQANSVLWAGLKPVFHDEKQDLWPLVNERTLCYFPVHLLGVCGVSPTMTDDVPMIEDCCEAMGGQYPNGARFGTRGIAGSFSMFPSHTITTGEGGLIITSNGEFNEIARSIMNHGKWQSNDFNFKYLGINAKMTNLQAAIGCELVDRIDEVNEQRRWNVGLYNFYLKTNFKVTSPHCYPVFYPSQEARDSALDVFYLSGIEARKLMGCCPDYDHLKEYDGDFPNARLYADTGLFLPVHQNLKEKEIAYICKIVDKTRK